jgi:glycosyltransferase involved in cell wall biosynthesis
VTSSAPVSAGPLVSVAIPTYERPELLHQSLATAVGQTYRNLEIIVHDNASVNDPAPVVAAFADPRITLYRNPRNLGQTANITAAIAKCRGKYIAPLADDDFWEPDMIASLVAPLERHPEAVIAFCDHDVVGPDGAVDVAASDRCTRRYGRDRLAAGLHRPFARIALRRQSILTLSASVLRREAADWTDMPADLPAGSDLYLAYLAARTGGACFYVKRRLTHYRILPVSLSNDVRHVLDARIRNVRAAYAYWTRFQRDPRITEAKAYLAMKRAGNAARLVMLLLRQGRGRSAVAALQDDLRAKTAPLRCG